MPKTLVGALALVFIAVVGGAWFVRDCRAATVEADRQTAAFLQAMDRSDYETAFSLFCSGSSSRTYEEFKAQIAPAQAYFNGYVQHTTSSSGLTVSTSDSRRLDYEAEVTFSDGAVGQFVASFVRENGLWCLQEFELTGRPVPPPQPVLVGGPVPPTTAGEAHGSRLVETTLPLFEEYVRAVGYVAETTQTESFTYANAVDNPQLQSALEDAFRRAQDILRASNMNSPDERDCVTALLDWSRLATDYWNSLARASIDKLPGKWTYAMNFEREMRYRQGLLPEKCPALIGRLGTAWSQAP